MAVRARRSQIVTFDTDWAKHAAALDQLTRGSARSAVAVGAMRRAIKPVVKTAKAEVRATTKRRSGALAKSIGDKIKVYRSGVIVALVGARSQKTQFQGRAVNPANYLHLVSLGVKAHWGRGRMLGAQITPWRFQDHRGRWRTIRGKHPGVRPRFILERAAHRSGGPAMDEYRARWDELFTRELAKQKRRQGVT